MSVSGAGALGSGSRYLTDLVISRRIQSSVPLGTMTVNIIGSFIFGLVAGLVAHHHLVNIMSMVIGTGFCGGLTTASSAAFETARLFHQGKGAAALTTIVLGIGTSCIAASIGLGIALI